jgi:hypothetical protein
MDIETVNDILRTKKRPSAAKQVPVGNNNKPNVPSLKQRLAEVRREVATAMTTARKLGVHALIKQLVRLSFELASAESELNKIS